MFNLKNILIFSLLLSFFIGCGEEDVTGVVVETEGGTITLGDGGYTTPNITSSDIQNAIVRHNQIRSELYSNSNVNWNYTVATSAQAYANILAQNGEFEHDKSIYGENLFAASYKVDLVNAIDSWYAEKVNYNYNTNDCNIGKICGHYTQLIWKNSTEIGCGMAQYQTGEYKGWFLVVCRYNPAGNYIGEKPY